MRWKPEKKGTKISATNTDRSVGTQSLVLKSPKNLGDDVPEDTFTVQNVTVPADRVLVPLFQKDLRLTLEGDSNDYFGKGLSGGKLVVSTKGVTVQRRRKYHHR